MELLTPTDYFRHFLSERPAISPDRLAAELSIDRTNLRKIIKGKRKIPNPRRGDFYRLMKKYGYTSIEFDKEAYNALYA